MVFSAVELRAELTYVPHLNDSAVHAEMVRYAVAQFRAGHFPLDGWFPYLGLGSAVLLHYQSLGVMLTGLIGLGIGLAASLGFSRFLQAMLHGVSPGDPAILTGVATVLAGAAALALLLPALRAARIDPVVALRAE